MPASVSTLNSLFGSKRLRRPSQSSFPSVRSRRSRQTNLCSQTNQGGSTTDRKIRSRWQVLEEKVGANYKNRYVWSPSYIDALVTRDRDTDANGTLDERLFAQHDGNFNVTAITNTSGAVQERMTYNPFGAVAFRDSAGSTISVSSKAWDILHQGGQQDLIGNYDFRHRILSPTLGRWLTNDPLGFEAGNVNFYCYIQNAPINSLDSLGLFVDDFITLKINYRKLTWKLLDKFDHGGKLNNLFYKAFEINVEPMTETMEWNGRIQRKKNIENEEDIDGWIIQKIKRNYFHYYDRTRQEKAFEPGELNRLGIEYYEWIRVDDGKAKGPDIWGEPKIKGISVELQMTGEMKFYLDDKDKPTQPEGVIDFKLTPIIDGKEFTFTSGSYPGQENPPSLWVNSQPSSNTSIRTWTLKVNNGIVEKSNVEGEQ